MQHVSGENVYGIVARLFALPSVAQSVSDPNKNMTTAAQKCKRPDRVDAWIRAGFAVKKLSPPRRSDLDAEFAPYAISLKSR